MKRDDSKESSGPLKRPINTANTTEPVFPGYNKPVFELDYEKHGTSLINRKELEFDDICKYKQGFLSLITKITPFDKVGNYLFLICRGYTGNYSN